MSNHADTIIDHPHLFEAEPKVFKTKTGYCHILPDKIVWFKDKTLPDIDTLNTKNEIGGLISLYVLGAVFMSIVAYMDFSDGRKWSGLLFGAIALWMVVGIIFSRNNSSTAVVERNTIKQVHFVRGIFGLSRPRYVVQFMDEQGKRKNRLIMLPGIFSGGSKAVNQSLAIMQTEELL